MCLLILGTVGYYGYALFEFGKDIQKDTDDSPFKPIYDEIKEPVYQPPEWEGKERVNVLLLGGDSRNLGEHEVPRSDTIMVASIDPVTKSAQLFSILRDTYVEIPGHGMSRINSALALGGPELAMETVSRFIGMPIQYYFYVDFEGFIALIDAIGGIDFYVEKDMKYIDITDKEEYQIDLKQGMQHLDGHKALQYVRFRHDARSDYARTERQRNFMQAVFQKLKSTYSLIRLPATLDKVKPYIETNMSVTKMLELATLSYRIDLSTLQDAQLPPPELLREEMINGAAVITVEPYALRQFVKETLEKTAQSAAGDGANTGTTGETGSGDGAESSNDTGSDAGRHDRHLDG
jgi:LCP family protein required for cell wall assembly